LWSGLDAVAAPFATILITGGLVRSLGKADYGLLVVALAVSGLSAAVNPAISATTTKLVSQAAGARLQEEHAVARVITASVGVALLINILFLAGAMLFEKPLAALVFGTAAGSGARAGDILLLAVLTVCVQQFDGIVGAAIKGLEKFKQQALLELAVRLTGAALVIYVGALTADVRIVLATYCLTSTVSAGARVAVLRWLAPAGEILARPRRADLVQVFRFGSWMWLNAVASVAFGTVDRIVVGRILGMAAAAEFTIYLQLSQLIHFVPSSLFTFSFPLFSRLSAGGSAARSEIAWYYRKYRRVIVAIAVALATAIGVFRNGLLGSFAGSSFQPQNEWAFILLIGSFVVLACNIAPYYLLLGLGASRPVSLISSGSMLGSVALLAVLVPQGFGLQGAALARLAYACGTLSLVWVARRALRKL